MARAKLTQCASASHHGYLVGPALVGYWPCSGRLGSSLHNRFTTSPKSRRFCVLKTMVRPQKPVPVVMYQKMLQNGKITNANAKNPVQSLMRKHMSAKRKNVRVDLYE